MKLFLLVNQAKLNTFLFSFCGGETYSLKELVQQRWVFVEELLINQSISLESKTRTTHLPNISAWLLIRDSILAINGLYRTKRGVNTNRKPSHQFMSMESTHTK